MKFTFNNISSGIYASFLEEQDHRDGYFFAGDGIIDSKFKIKNIAIYIQSNTKINLKSYLKVSFRYDTYKTDQNLSYSLYNWNYYSWNDYGTYLFTEKDNNIGGTISLIYNKNSFLSFFISHAIGYKTSGINQSPNFPNNRIYDTETSNNTEIGYKFKDSTLSLDFTSFYVHRNNPQLRLFMQLDLNNPLSFDYATFNGSDSYSSGFELDLSINYKKINIYNSLSLLNTHIGTFLFDEDNNGELESFGSRNSAHSPEKQYIIGFNYYFKNLNNGLSFSLESNYTDEFWFDDQNDHKSNSYNILNTTINYKFKSYLISFWGKNINDIIIPVRGFSFALEPDEVIRDYKSFGMKKTIGITIEYNI